MSDLHLEFTDYLPSVISSIGEDVVVLAGDIGVGLEGVRWACRAFGDRPVLYVMGNHEFYGHHFVELIEKARAETQGSRVRILEDEAVVIDGVRFLGCTFWTDFKLFGSPRQSQCMEIASFMSDYMQMLTGPAGMLRNVKPADTLARHKASCTWLNREIGQSKEPCVVITHHGPSFHVCEAEYRNDLLTAAFLNNADDLLRAPVKAWIYGHTHQVLNFEISGVPVLSNQRGYPSKEVPRFSWDTCFEIHHYAKEKACE
jgi:predicted phosphodiesterase